jgi:protoporphyrinogen oxidase
MVRSAVMSQHLGRQKKVVIVGAGPAGLTAAYQLCKIGTSSIVLEKDLVVGGISRTVHRNGYHFDIGGHRFFTKVAAVENLWHEILPDGDFLERNRMSRVYHDKKFFDYPLRATNALFGLGLWKSLQIAFSYLRARLAPVRKEVTFEHWVSNRFGKRLYEIFFKTYTEKVWGMPCSRLSADWAAQRIKGLSLLTAVKNALLSGKRGSRSAIVKTLIESFQYPKRGPGMMWERVAQFVQSNGSELKLDSNVQKVQWKGNRITAVESVSGGKTERITGTHFISTMPVRELIQNMDPPPPSEVLKAANRLGYRDFLTVALVVDHADLFPDHWIYVHDQEVKVGRIQNFKNWSPFMVPDPAKSCIGLEYFCFEGDGLWAMDDRDLIDLAKREMEVLGLLGGCEVEDAHVVRMPKAYPVYDGEYAEAVATVRSFVDGIDNLYLVGRNGMHKYNNQDHSMLTAMLAVENINGADHDIWSVNVDQDYHEVVTRDEEERREAADRLAATQPDVPVPLTETARTEAIIHQAFARLHKAGLAVALGSVSGLYLWLATAGLLIKGGEQVGPNLALLGQYFIGYDISWPGAFIGLLYGFFWGFIVGWMIAYLRNLSLGIYVHLVRRRAEVESLRKFLDYI